LSSEDIQLRKEEWNEASGNLYDEQLSQEEIQSRKEERDEEDEWP